MKKTSLKKCRKSYQYYLENRVTFTPSNIEDLYKDKSFGFESDGFDCLELPVLCHDIINDDYRYAGVVESDSLDEIITLDNRFFDIEKEQFNNFMESVFDNKVEVIKFDGKEIYTYIYIINDNGKLRCLNGGEIDDTVWEIMTDNSNRFKNVEINDEYYKFVAESLTKVVKDWYLDSFEEETIKEVEKEFELKEE